MDAAAFVHGCPAPATASTASPWLAARHSRLPVASAPARRAALRMDITKDLVTNLTEARVFKTLLAAAGVTGAFGPDTPGTYTVFAPSDDAFARLRPGTLEHLLRPENKEKLLRIVQYHLVSGLYPIKKLQGVGELPTVYGGPLGYFGSGNVVRVGGVLLEAHVSNVEASNGIIHVVDTVIVPPGVKPAGIDAGYIAPKKLGGSDSVVTSFYTPLATPSVAPSAARGATLPATVGGRRAMGLQNQLPFWMYGPPYNAAYQTDYEPISAAEPAAAVDYQLMPEGSVVVVPDSVDANEINPISGMSKFIGKTARLVEGAGLSDYSSKTTSMD